MAITRMAKTPTGAGYGGEQSNKQVIRFEKGPDENVFIRLLGENKTWSPGFTMVCK